MNNVHPRCVGDGDNDRDDIDWCIGMSTMVAMTLTGMLGVAMTLTSELKDVSERPLSDRAPKGLQVGE